MSDFPKITWEVLTDAEVSEYEAQPYEKPKGNPHQVHCLCGRFAKWGGDQHYYNGQFDCYRYTVICSRCGSVDIECV